MVSSRNFLFSNRGFSREEKAIYVIYHISDRKDKQQQQQIGSMTKKIEIFSKQGHSKILVRESFFRPPKLGAKSPSMATQNNHIIYMYNQCFGMPHSFIDDRFLCKVRGFSWPARVPLHMVFHKVLG